MIEVIEKTDDLIDEFNNTLFVKDMKKLKNKIIEEKLINTSDVRVLFSNPTIHKYVENQNILDLHILYLNNKIKEITKGEL